MCPDKKNEPHGRVREALLRCLYLSMHVVCIMAGGILFDDSLGGVVVYDTFSLDVFAQGHDALMTSLVHDTALCFPLSDGGRDKS